MLLIGTLHPFINDQAGHASTEDVCIRNADVSIICHMFATKRRKNSINWLGNNLHFKR